MKYIFSFLVTAAGSLLTYLFNQRYIDRYIKSYPKKIFYRHVIIACVVAWGGALIVYFLTKGPDYFEAGIDQLREKDFVFKKVGDFNSYSYNPQLFKKSSDLASFDVELDGNGNALFLTCFMKKQGDTWSLTEIRVNKFTTGQKQQ